jgi:hypothetical protein
MRSGDNGKTINNVKTFENFLTVQAIKEDPFSKGVFYAYIDGKLDIGAGLYKSEDSGFTWNKLPLALPPHIKTLPHKPDWIENELLSVTYGQIKNVCGTNQLLCLDPHHRGTLYFGEWTEGIYKVADDGKMIADISKGLPFHADTATALVDIKVDEYHKNVIYAGFIHEGLWRSSDGGVSWSKVFPGDASIFNASSIVISGEGERLFVACEPLYWSNCISGVFYSGDSGKSWKNLYDQEFGQVRWKGIAIDKSRKVLYGVSCGNGAFYYDL